MALYINNQTSEDDIDFLIQSKIHISVCKSFSGVQPQINNQQVNSMTRIQHKHSMGTCVAQLTCLRKVCGHVTVSNHRLSKPEGFNVSLYVVVNIANEDKKLQTPGDIIPLYASSKSSLSV
jgi:hypothetical protein